MTRILFFENGVGGGGSFVSLLHLAAHLDRTRFAPFAAFVNRTPFLDRFRAVGIPVFLLWDPVYSTDRRYTFARAAARLLIAVKRLLPFGDVFLERLIHAKTMRAVRRIIRDEHIDIVHCNDQSVRDLYGIIAAANERIPCVSHLRSARVAALPQRVARFLNAHVRIFVANSRFTKRYWEKLGIDPSRIVVVYNAIADEKHAPLDIRAAFGIASSVRFVIGCVGNLAEGKGQDFLLRAFAHVRAEEPNTALLLVGEGPRRSALERLADDLGIRAAVHFAGYDTRARAIIAALDVLALPSETETFGRTLLEAMRAGTPIVATRVGGIPEIVEHERTGLLVPFGDVEEFSAALLRILRNRTFARRFAENGRQRVREHFALSAHLREMESLYQSLS